MNATLSSNVESWEKDDSSGTSSSYAGFLNSKEVFAGVLNSMGESIVILDHERRVLFANNAFFELLNVKDPASVIGLRPGEVFGCFRMKEGNGVCGTNEQCVVCGIRNAVLASLDGSKEVNKCSIMSSEGNVYEFKVSALPVRMMGKPCTILILHDISKERRIVLLERVFFHDILNTSNLLLGYAELMKDFGVEVTKDMVRDLYGITLRLINEISAQRQLLSAERGELDVQLNLVNSQKILECIISDFNIHNGHVKKG